MTKIQNSKWRTVFLRDISQKMKSSKAEFEKYKVTGRLIHLQQACNKLFSAVENYLMLKYDKRVRSYSHLLSLVAHNQNDAFFLQSASQLHYFYYNGELQMSKEESVIGYHRVNKILKERVRRYL